MSFDEEGWDEFNVVLLGETGAGKSTFVNAFANYFAFNSFEEAKNYQPIVLITSHFTEKVGEDGGVHQFKAFCTLNKERNADKEHHMTGESATQVPHSYVFPFSDRKMFLRIVDTPGIGDTRGFKQDADNMREIVRYLAFFGQLHAIVVLMPANGARLTPSVQFCLDELLVHLPRGAQKNVFFGFTNSAAHDFTPGEGYRTVGAYLKQREQQSGIEIPFSGDTIYCFDNMAFRAHCALLADEELFETMHDDGKEVEHCFGESRDQAERLLEKLHRLQPIPTDEITELKDLRTTLRRLCVPRAVLREKKNNNVNARSIINDRLADNNTELATCRGKQLTVQEVWEKQQLSQRHTVCSSAVCLQKQSTQSGYDETIYRICHNNCTCYRASVISAANLVDVHKCSMMQNQNSAITCRACNCSWMTHMQVDFTMVKVRKPAHDIVVKKRIDDLELQIKNDTAQKDIIDKEDKILDEELKIIRDTCLSIAAHIKELSIIYKNKGFLEIVDHAINEEKGLGSGSAKLDELQKMKAEHEEEILLFTESETVSATKYGSSDVTTAIEKIRALKIAGPHYKEEDANVEMNYDALEIDVPISEKREEVERDRREHEKYEKEHRRECEQADQERQREEMARQFQEKRAELERKHAEDMAILKKKIQMAMMLQDSSSSSSSGSGESSDDE